MTERYVCSTCGAGEERSYRVQFFVLTCPDCGDHAWFVHESLLAVLDDVAPADRPSGWDEMTLEEQFRHVIERGLVDREDLSV